MPWDLVYWSVMQKDYSILIGGEAGQGSRFASLIIAQLFNQLGYSIYIYEDYQSLIRGGHNFSQIRAVERGIQARKEEIDFLLALDKKTLDLHGKKLAKNGLVIFNKDRIKTNKGLGIEIEKIPKEIGGKPIMANTALVSAFAKIVGVNWKVLEKVLKKEIRREIDLNLKVGRRAYEVSKNLLRIKRIPKKSTSLLTGNEAVALGMVKAGLKFYFAYPMTPATSIMNFLARNEDKFKTKVIQPENEISVINMALGASFAGKKSACGTSGGGFALMTETLSLAAQSETPILIVESQRAAPATGVPTYNLQGDLSFVLSAGHGDFVRFVIAPGDANQCLSYSALGLNLAWKYQTPVILLLDKDVSENTFSCDEKILKKIKSEEPLLWNKKGGYKRYRITKDGISPLAFPGQRNVAVKVNSYEHDEYGITTDREKEIMKMLGKRKRKFKEMEKEVERQKAIEVYGKRNSKVALIGWGISKGPAKEAAENLGIKLIQPIIIEPFPKKQMQRALKGVEKIICVEMNSLGQMAKVIEAQGIKVDAQILKYTGRPFFAREIEEKIRKIV